MRERYLQAPEPEPRSLPRRIGRVALATTAVTVSVAIGAVGGYELARVVTEVLGPAVQHETNNILNDLLDSQQP